jgi:hypothetical protein
MICLPFIDDDCQESDQARRQVLADCHSDVDLLVVANAGAALGRQHWLMEHTLALAAADSLQDRATGLMIAAFSHVTDIAEVEAVVTAARVDGTWLEDTARDAIEQANRHIRARYWYRLCLDTEDRAAAWCHFILMLQLVDRRCWSMMDDVDTELRDAHPWVARRIKAIHAVDSVIKHAVKENEKEVGNRYLGLRLSRPQMAPWVGTTLRG